MTIPLRSAQKIAQLKKRLTDQIQLEYADSREKLTIATNRLHYLSDEVERARNEIAASGKIGISVAELRNWTHYMSSQEIFIVRQQEVVDQLNDTSEIIHQRLIVHHQNERIWEKVCDRIKTQLSINETLREQAELDEIATTRFVRR